MGVYIVLVWGSLKKEGAPVLVISALAEEHSSVSPRNQKKSECVTLVISPWLAHQNTPSAKLGSQKGISLDEKILQGTFRLCHMRRGEPLSKLLDVEEQYKKMLQDQSGHAYCSDVPLFKSSSSGDISVFLHPPASASFDNSIKGDWLNSAVSSKLLAVNSLSLEDMISRVSSASTVTELAENQHQTSSEGKCGDESKAMSVTDVIPDLHSIFKGDPAEEALTRLRAKRKERKMNSRYFSKSTSATAEAVPKNVFPNPETKQWHRRLSILIWIMETMKTTEPYLRRPFTTCWQLCQPDLDPEKARKHFEKTKKDLALWQTVESQAKLDDVVLCEGSIATSAAKTGYNKFRAAARLMQLYVKAAPHGRNGEEDEDNKTNIDKAEIQGEGLKTFKIAKKDSDSAVKDKPSLKLPPIKKPTVKIQSVQSPKRSERPAHGSNPSASTKFSVKDKISATSRGRKPLKLPPIAKSSLPKVTLIENKKLSKQKLKKRSSGGRDNDSKESWWDLPKLVLDPSQIREQFHQIRTQKESIICQQLRALERDARAGIKQRFTSLEVKSNFYGDLRQMREGVVVESAEMARKRLLVNFEWFEDLKSTLPGSALENVHINKVLEKMEPMCEYICQNTEKMSCNRLLAVLGTLRRWEIDHNDVEFSVKYIIDHVIYLPEVRYKNWLQRHYQHLKTKNIDDVEALSIDGQRLPIY